MISLTISSYCPEHFLNVSTLRSSSRWRHFFTGPKNLLQLTTSLLITVVGTVVIPIAHLSQRDAVPIVTSELGRRAGGRWSVAHVLQLIRFVAAVVVTVTDEVM